ncbi:MAG TPA: hypothetical protein VKK30_07730, partial [Actinomycetota bacterium]|nr:hypothetical protein [Actinomycetota bacterium]
NFQRDVKLLFREADRRRMMWAFDLWDAASVREHAADILRRMEQRDLPFEGGFPEEHQTVFRLWMETGMTS